ncbi:hypothetical protein [Leisingera caerulea]|uniref:hypothetical protein n=1 Tax=Leisingera caerulea TaxID=506591 RepID=UPI0003F91A8C|nr:hypothetical protein [Leisingera caerulea]
MAAGSPFDLVLAAEVRASRIEGHLAADPVIAAQWRSEAAVAEAAASIGLEDLRLSETDLLVRVSENPETHADVRAIEDALSVLRFLRAPGDPANEPLSVLDRIARLSARAETYEPLPEVDDEMVQVFARCRGRAPLLEAIRASAHYAALTERRSPVAERLVFAAAEHLSRSRVLGGASRSRHMDDPLRGLGGRVDASWVILPSLALTRMRFRIWSPLNPKAVQELLQGIGGILDQELGRVITIRAWREKAAMAARGKSRRSRLPDAVDAFGIEPVMTSQALADRLGITQRGAIKLLGELVEQGLLVEMTRRRSARIWATPGLAALLGRRAEPAGRAAPAAGIAARGSPGLPQAGQSRAGEARRIKEENKAAVERALADFDAVLEQVDGILGKRGG